MTTLPTRSQAAPAPSLRERKKDETRTAIHEAALRLVAENGASHASVDAICSEAGVSTRTFFNYFPSKVAALVGRPAFTVTDAQRATFLQHPDERWLVSDLATLVGGIMDSTSREGADREALRSLLARRPEVAGEMIRFATELRGTLMSLAEQRTTPLRAQLAVNLVMSAVDCALHRPLESADVDFTPWLLDTVTTMHELAGASLP